jgi:S1-C subfamily serine protease
MEADATQLAGRDRETTPSRERGGAQPMESELGVSVEPLSQEDAAERSLEAVRDAGGGLVVTDVAPQGPAAGKLFPPSQGATDIILKIDGQPVRSRADLRAALRKVKSGDIATLVVFTLPGDGSEGRQRVARIRIP